MYELIKNKRKLSPESFIIPYSIGEDEQHKSGPWGYPIYRGGQQLTCILMVRPCRLAVEKVRRIKSASSSDWYVAKPNSFEESDKPPQCNVRADGSETCANRACIDDKLAFHGMLPM